MSSWHVPEVEKFKSSRNVPEAVLKYKLIVSSWHVPEVVHK